MANTIKRFGGWLERRWRALPWVVRLTLVLSKWLQGIQGLPALVATVLALITTGALFLWTLPTWTMALWSGAALLAIYGGAGAIGVTLKAKSGRIDLMTDRAFWDYVAELVEDLGGYLALGKVISQAGKNPTSAHVELVKALSAPRSTSALVGEGMAVLAEAQRRGLISEAEHQHQKEDLKRILAGLQAVLARLPQLTGLRGYRPKKRLAPRIAAHPSPESESGDPET